MIDLRGNGGGLLERGDHALRPVHRQGPGRPGQGRLGRQAPRRRRGGDRLGRPARRPDRPPQRQRLGDLRRRDQGLRPRPDHRRLQHLRQGDRPEHRPDQRAAPPPRPTRSLGALKLTIQQFYRANGESTQVKGVDARHPHPLAPRPGRLRRREDGQRPEVRQGRRRCRTTSTTASRPTWSPGSRPARGTAARPTPSSRSRTSGSRSIAERKARHAISLNEAKFRAEFVPDEEADEDKAEEVKKDKKKKYHRAPGLGVRLLQRRGRPDRHRLPDPRLEGPGRGPGACGGALRFDR